MDSSERGFPLAGKLLFLRPRGQAQRYLRNRRRRDYSGISTKKSLLFQKNVGDAGDDITPSSSDGVLLTLREDPLPPRA